MLNETMVFWWGRSYVYNRDMLDEMLEPEKDAIRVLVVEPEKKPYVKEIGSDLASLQHEVGGYIEAVYPFEAPVAIICDEEAKLKGRPLNRALRDTESHIFDIVAGTFLIVGLGEEDFASLEEEHIEEFSEVFASPELFVRMNGKLMVIPVEEVKTDMQQRSFSEHIQDAEAKAGGKTAAKENAEKGEYEPER